MKNKIIRSFAILLSILCLLVTFIGCTKKNEAEEISGTTLEFEIGDLLAKTLYISGEKTLWIYEYKSFPVMTLQDIEKDGSSYILVLENALTGKTTKVSVKKGTVLDVKKSTPLDIDLFGVYEAIMGARGHIPTELKVVSVSKTKLVVVESEKK